MTLTLALILKKLAAKPGAAFGWRSNAHVRPDRRCGGSHRNPRRLRRRLPAAALGVQGLAPYFFEVEATAYVGAGSRRKSDDLQFVAGVRAWF